MLIFQNILLRHHCGKLMLIFSWQWRFGFLLFIFFMFPCLEGVEIRILRRANAGEELQDGSSHLVHSGAFSLVAMAGPKTLLVLLISFCKGLIFFDMIRYIIKYIYIHIIIYVEMFIHLYISFFFLFYSFLFYNFFHGVRLKPGSYLLIKNRRQKH